MTQTSPPVPQPRAAGASPSPSVSPNNTAEPGKSLPTPPSPIVAGAPEVEQYHHEPDFWHKKWVVVGMPIATSLLLHIGLFVLLIIGAIVFGTVVAPKATQEQTVIPDSTMQENTPVGGVQFTGVNNDPFHQALQDKDPNGTEKGFADTKGPAADPSSMGGGAGDNNDRTIGVGDGSGFGTGHGGGSGSGDSTGSGDGQGGPLAMFGHPGGGGFGPHGPVFGNGGNALTIAFVCDASGSMMEKMEALKHQLSNAVEQLHPFQKFSITFFQNESPTFIDHSLILATPENKRKAENFLADVSTNGTTDPIPGLDIAFGQHPQLIYLLTDGDFPDNPKVLAEIHKLNADHKVKINTIAFVGSSDHDTEFKKLLSQVAQESGGTFKQVEEEDLQ